VRSCSLKVALLFHVETGEDFRAGSQLVVSTLINRQSQVRDGTSEILDNFPLPFRGAFTIVNQIVVGLEDLLDLGENGFDSAGRRESVCVESKRCVVCVDPGFQSVNDAVQVAGVLEDVVKTGVVGKLCACCLKVSDLLFAKTSCQSVPVLLSSVEVNCGLDESADRLMVVLVDLMERLLHEFTLKHLGL